FAPQRVRETLHELRRLAQLDLKDHREIAIAAEPIEVEVRDVAEPLQGIRDAGERGASLGDRLGHHALEDRDEQVVLAAEVEVDGACGHPGRARDVGDLRAEESAAREGVDGGAKDRVALVPAGQGSASAGGAWAGTRRNGGL